MENPCFTCFSQFIGYAPSTSSLFLTWRRLRLWACGWVTQNTPPTTGLVCVLQQIQPPGFQRNRLFLPLCCHVNQTRPRKYLHIWVKCCTNVTKEFYINLSRRLKCFSAMFLQSPGTDAGTIMTDKCHSFNYFQNVKCA